MLSMTLMLPDKSRGSEASIQRKKKSEIRINWYEDGFLEDLDVEGWKNEFKEKWRRLVKKQKNV